MERRWWWALIGIAGVGGVLRALPFFRDGGWGYPVGYDQGVYFTASALLLRGFLPYRDFMFVHPPGALLLWLPGTVLTLFRDPAACFAFTQWLAAGVGALNVFLVGRLGSRTWGSVAGLVAALLYATHPEAVFIERGPSLEPLLNLTCLALALVWLAPPREGPDRSRWFWAGVFGGLAVTVKALGAIWLAATLVSRPARSSWKSWLGMGLVATGTVALILAPFVLASPSDFFSDVLLFQLRRPGDGELDRIARVKMILHDTRGASLVLTLAGLLLATIRAFLADHPSRPAERFFAVVYVLTGLAFLTSPSFFIQYGAFLAAPEALLVGMGVAAVHGWLFSRQRWVARAVVVPLALAAPLASVREVRESSRLHTEDHHAIGRYLRTLPAEASLCSFEPAWALAGGRLPTPLPGAPLLVDSYALMLWDAMGSPQRFATTRQAFQSPEAQRHILPLLERCRFVMLGGRAWQLSEESLQGFRARFVQRFPADGQPLWMDVWERQPPAN